MLYRNMSDRPRRPSNSNPFRQAVLFLALALAGAAGSGFQTNRAAQDFKIPDLQGNPKRLDDFSGKATILLFWRPEAERARDAVCTVSKALSSGYDGTRLVTIVSGEHAKADIESVLEHCGGQIPVLLDRDRAAFAAYQVIALPTLIILSPDHSIKYKEAGFSHEGISALTAKLDELYGKGHPTMSVPEGSPEAIRRYGLAMQFLKKGLNERAEELLLQLVKDHPEYRPAWVGLGYSRIAQGKIEQSRESLEKAHDLDRNNSDVAAGLAWVWWKKGDSAQSAKWAALVTGNDPNSGLLLGISKSNAEP
jgi:peroxiredoxin